MDMEWIIKIKNNQDLMGWIVILIVKWWWIMEKI